ncbi:uncharacterized protein BP5553_05367 [Venustampulla echinocandica]|uniref:STF2-like protein n=1 Tax=Venustampulla echinocandica TaxID=2656787 RepID=A0A370TQZ9_9HELO|nr:uncharacterized protein BP5553_05367 [Venustampulla echinocandica]RDL37934.1 hypothetical protein BP5553_05367 [Venustampulla echinocandica]
MARSGNDVTLALWWRDHLLNGPLLRTACKSPSTTPICDAYPASRASISFLEPQLPVPIEHITNHHQLTVGKTHKFNDRDHAGLADGTALPIEHLPRYFAKHGHADVDPKKTKKNGAGKGGWGVEGEEVQDEGFKLTNARRRSNSSSYTSGLKDFKTKFEQVEHDPVFEEDVHGPGEDAHREDPHDKVESSDSSVEEEDKAKSV